MPSAKPSTLPSASPSTLPSSQPTAQPSSVPTSQPTTSPTAVPSSGPSGIPSTRPTPLPSFPLPSLSPSATSTSWNSSLQPSSSPSLLPAPEPTETPTSLMPARSEMPSSVPQTVLPVSSLNPTLISSFVPTLPIVEQWKNALLSDLQSIAVNDSVMDVAVRTSYYTLRYSDESFYGNGCAGWVNWLYSEVRALSSGYVPSSIQMWSRTSLQSNSVIDCMEKNVINSILYALLTPANSTTDVVQSFFCSGYSWKVSRNCGRSTRLNDLAICANCDNPCNISQFGLAQCSSYYVNQSIDPSSTILSLTLQDIDKPPVIQQMSIFPDVNKISINVSLDKPGTVSCSLYSSGLAVPTSLAEITLQAGSASAVTSYSVQAGEVAAMEIASGIIPLASYNLYCYTVARASGASSSLSTMLQQVVKNVTTMCCRSIRVRISSSLISEGMDQPSNFLSFIVEGGRPRSPLEVRIVLQKVNASDNSETFTSLEALSSAFVPSIFTLSPSAALSSSSPSSLRFSSGLSKLSAGDYQVSLSITGFSASDYNVVYPSGFEASDSMTLTVLPAGAILLAPAMLNAVFSSDGSYLQVLFSGDTNRGGMSTRFSCSRLFRFGCAESSTCVWQDTSTVWAYVSAQPECALPGQTLSLAPSAAIKARCASAGCVGNQVLWPNISTSASSSFLTIAAPSPPIAPIVIMNMPTSLGSCSSLRIDVTLSTGHGGRAWNSSKVSVSVIDTAGNVVNASSLQEFLSSDTFKLFPQPMAIPAAYFQDGHIYTFQATLCNFLGACGSAMGRLIIISSLVPSVSIPGNTLRSMKPNALLSIRAVGTIPTCSNAGGNNVTTREYLSYSWSISSGSGSSSVPLNLRSISKDPARFLLPAFSLQINTLYTISVTTSLSLTSSSATSVSTQVYVVPGDLVAVIGGSNTRNMRVGERLTLDASRSYDENMEFSLGSPSSSLFFAWSCLQLAPVLSDDCSTLFHQALYEESLSSNLLQLQALDFNVNLSSASVKWTVKVADDSSGSGRSAEADVFITILPSLSPVVELSAVGPVLSVTSDGSINRYNSEQPLQLVGRVKVPASLSGWVSWQLDPSSSGVERLSSVVLISSATTDVSNLTLPVSSVPRTYTFSLPLNAQNLPTGITLLFSLSCVLQEPGGSAISNIAVQINSPPRFGLFA
eukprot:gene27049-32683_t